MHDVAQREHIARSRITLLLMYSNALYEQRRARETYKRVDNCTQRTRARLRTLRSRYADLHTFEQKKSAALD